MKTYTTKSGAQQFKPALSALTGAVEDQAGFCLACGDEVHGIEPDARKCKCEGCGAHKVYGAEELMLMGLYHE